MAHVIVGRGVGLTNVENALVLRAIIKASKVKMDALRDSLVTMLRSLTGFVVAVMDSAMLGTISVRSSRFWTNPELSKHIDI